MAYLALGLSLSFVQNLLGLLTGGLTAFAWTGSWTGQAVLLAWWFVVPALVWPVDVYWWAYHRLYG